VAYEGAGVGVGGAVVITSEGDSEGITNAIVGEGAAVSDGPGVGLSVCGGVVTGDVSVSVAFGPPKPPPLSTKYNITAITITVPIIAIISGRLPPPLERRAYSLLINNTILSFKRLKYFPKPQWMCLLSVFLRPVKEHTFLNLQYINNNYTIRHNNINIFVTFL
jgi:hypothetical protein